MIRGGRMIAAQHENPAILKQFTADPSEPRGIIDWQS